MSHVDHEWTKEQIAAHLAGGLSAEERARLEAHASGCAECIAEIDAARRFDRSMDDLFAPIRPRAGLEDRVVGALRRVAAKKPPSMVLRMTMAVAAVLMLGAVGWAIMDIGDFAPPRASNARRSPRDEFGQRAIPKDDRISRLPEEPAIFFAEAKESDHEESADNEDYKQMKGDSKDFLSYGKGETGGIRGRLDLAAAPAASSEPSYDYRKNASEKKAAPDPGYFKPGEAQVGNKPASAPVLASKIEHTVSPSGKVSVPQSPPPAQPPQEPQLQRKIIRSGEMEFEIEAFDSTVARITAIAAEEGGFVATVNSEKLPNGKVRGTVVLRAPPERLDTLLLKLRALGELKSQRIGSQDVTKSYYDIESRLRAARTMEERLINIIKEGKGSIKDLLLAEKELGEWRTKSESFEGEIRYYNSLISLSTLTITLYEKEIRSPFAVTETERVNVGLEVEEVETVYKEVLTAVATAKGRVTRSELKKHDAGQYNAVIHFEVAPDASGPLRDRLKQMGNVARLDIDRLQETEGGSGKAGDLKVRQKDTQFILAIYNLTNVSPRETVHLSLACVDVEKSAKTILARVEKAAGRVRSSNLNRQKDQTSGVIDFEIRAADADAVLLDVRAEGEGMHFQITENPDTANVTRSKRGFVVNLVALSSVQAAETMEIQLAAKDVSTAYRLLLEEVRKAEGRIFSSNLDEKDRRNVTATVAFDVRREYEKAITDAMARAGEVYTRTATRREGSHTKIQLHLTFFNVVNIPARENVTLGVNVGDVEKAVEALHAIAVEFKGRVVDSHHNRDGGRNVSRVVIDVPLKDARFFGERVKKLGELMVETSRANTAVPDSDLAMAKLDITLSNEVILSADSAPWASIKKGLSVSFMALSWSLTLVMIGLCFILPLALVLWACWRIVKRVKRDPASAQ